MKTRDCSDSYTWDHSRHATPSQAKQNAWRTLFKFRRKVRPQQAVNFNIVINTRKEALSHLVSRQRPTSAAFQFRQLLPRTMYKWRQITRTRLLGAAVQLTPFRFLPLHSRLRNFASHLLTVITATPRRRSNMFFPVQLGVKRSFRHKIVSKTTGFRENRTGKLLYFTQTMKIRKPQE